MQQRFLKDWNIRIGSLPNDDTTGDGDENGLQRLPCMNVVSYSPFDGTQHNDYVFIDRPRLAVDASAELMRDALKKRVYLTIAQKWDSAITESELDSLIDKAGGAHVLFPKIRTVQAIYDPSYHNVVPIGTGSWAVFEKIMTNKSKGFEDFPEIATVRDQFDQYAIRLLTLNRWDWDTLGPRDKVEAVLKKRMIEFFDNPKAELYMLDIRDM